MADADGAAITDWLPRWVRGEASIRGGVIALDEDRSEEFNPSAFGYEDDLAFDVAAVRSVDDIPAFARQWGLLRPDQRGRQRVADFMSAADGVRTVLEMYHELLQLLDGSVAVETYRRRWAPLATLVLGNGSAEKSDADFLEATLQIIVSMVNAELVGAEFRLDYEPVEPGSGGAPFAFNVQPRDLLSLAYFHLATLLMQREPLRACLECRRLFVPKDARQVYHSPTCSARVRQRRRASTLRKEG